MPGSPQLNIIIIGAGIGGLGASLATVHAGHRALILEQASDFVEIGAGVQVPPNASRELIRWGLQSDMAAIASRPNRINYRNWVTGLPEGCTDMTTMEEKYGAPYWQVFRPDYHAVLLSAAVKKGVHVRRGCPVVEYRPSDGSVVLEDGEVVRGDLVIAADGIKSVARRSILGGNLEPRETGDTCFRTVIPTERLFADQELAHLVTNPGFEQFLGPDHHIIGYNMQGNRLYNLLMVIPDDRSMVGYKAPATASDVRRAYKGWNPMIQKLLSILPDELERWRLIDLPVIHDWLHPSGRLIIIGDAVHATLPYLAQGAAMAIEDAAALGVALSNLTSPAQLSTKLETFYRLRAPRVHAIQRGSYSNRFFIHMSEPEILEMRRTVFAAGDYPGNPNLMGNSLFQKWLYGFDMTEEAERHFNPDNAKL